MRDREAVPFQDLPPTVFAPNGRVYAVEDLVNAVTSDTDLSSNTLVVIKCKEGVVAVTSLPSSPYMQYDVLGNKDGGKESARIDKFDDTEEARLLLLLLLDDEETGENPAAIAPFGLVNLAANATVLAVTAGNVVDAQVLRNIVLNTADQVRAEQGSDILSVVARKLADQRQLRTMEAGNGRVLAAVAVLFSCDTIWRVDPAGHFWLCQAVTSGRYAAAAERLLVKAITTNQSVNAKQLSRKQALAILSEFTIDEALAIATKCIIEAHNKVSKRFSSRAISSTLTIRLRGVSLARDGQTVRSFSHRNLVPFLGRTLT